MIPGTIPVGNFVNTFGTGFGTRTASFIGTDYDEPVGGDSSFSFSGTSLGTAASDRWIIVGVHGLMTATGYSATTILNTCTVNGYKAAPVVQVLNSQSNAIVGILVAYCPLGTTGTVVINFDSDVDACYISVWEVNGLVGFAPYASNTDISGSMSFSLNTLADGFIIAVGEAEDTFIGPASWTNVTERFDEENAIATGLSTATHTVTGADTTTSGSPVTVSLSIGNQDGRALVAASF